MVPGDFYGDPMAQDPLEVGREWLKVLKLVLKIVVIMPMWQWSLCWLCQNGMPSSGVESSSGSQSKLPSFHY